MNGAVTLVIGVVMVVGVAGTVLPFIPGLLLVWGGGLAYAFVRGFDSASIAFFVALTVLALAGKAASVVVPGKRGAAHGAPWTTLAAGAAGAVIGAFAIPVAGLLAGGVLGILLAEQRRLGDWARAWATTKSVLVGVGIGALLELGAGMLMLAVWVVWALTG